MTDETPTHPISSEPEPEPDPADDGATVDAQDVRLSAALDGETAPDDAIDTGDDARTVARRQDLAAARDLLATPPPPLDDVTRRRMLRNAVAELPAPRAHRSDRANRMMAAAAVIAVVVVGGFALKALSNTSDNKSKSATASKAADSATTTPAAADERDLHEISDPEVLRSRVESLLRTAPAPTESFGSTQTTSVPAEGGIGSDDLDRAAANGCLSAVKVPAGATPSVLADATFDGSPAFVVVAHDGPRTLIFVLAKDDCRLLTSQFLKE